MCSFEGCGKPPEKRGWCGAHYQHWRKKGVLKPLKVPNTNPCRVVGCPTKPKAKGYCDTHYTRWRKYGDPIAPRKLPSYSKLPCKVPRCTTTRRQQVNYYCADHMKAAKYRVLRDRVTEAYGGACTCCTEPDSIFLTIEHVGGWGREHRADNFTGLRLMQWIMDSNYPEDITILCFNCNCSKNAYGRCPHEWGLYDYAELRDKRLWG